MKTPTYIDLCGSFYEVRNIGGTRHVLVETEWIAAIDFPNWLINQNRHDEWSELVLYGATKSKP